jgi:putative glycosyltransferase (TIGR04348 family)
MRIFMACPAPPGSVKGNRVTADRWARLLRQLGHRVVIGGEWHGESSDVLIALHARKSHDSLARYRKQAPGGPAVVCLTGTDLYRDFPRSKKVWNSLAWADRLVVLQPRAKDHLPPEFRGKVRTIFQSVEVRRPAVRRHRADVFEVCVLGHLRWEKDPLRAGLALRRIGPESTLRVVQAGEPLEPRYAVQAERLMAREPRYQWLGKLSRAEARRLLARSRAIVMSSRLEGGANVVSEAIALGVPVLASEIPGNVGLLGAGYPAYYPVGDTATLARLMTRLENDAGFRGRLERWVRKLQKHFSPDQERLGWKRLLAELTGGAGS